MKLESVRSLKALIFLSIFWALGVVAAGVGALSLPAAKTDSRASEAIELLISRNETEQSQKVLAAVSKSVEGKDRLLAAQSSTIHSFGAASVGVGLFALATAIGSMIVLTRARKLSSEQFVDDNPS